MKPPIYVTQPQLPPLNEFIPYLEEIWQTKTLTNNGRFHQELEARLCEYLGVPFISLFNNGTNALLTALQALEISGEVITTPFTFVATTNAILWRGLTPVFVDIDPVTLNLDPASIEAAITPQTSAIVAVHCYGQPCDVEAIETIAKRHGLKVLYDAAHAFAVECHCGSVLNHGDLSVLSFHATKVFNTLEGGAIVSQSAEMKQRIDRLKNFGIVNETEVIEAGLNGKMNEVQAAFGLVQLPYVHDAIAARRNLDAYYRQELAGVTGIRCLGTDQADVSNYAYFPVLIESNYPLTREDLRLKLKEQGIIARRYFYPLTPDLLGLAVDAASIPNAAAAAEKILCLPLYPELSDADQQRIIAVILNHAG